MSAERQTASCVLMVRPARFGFNAETAPSNSFQRVVRDLDAREAQRRAQAEFDGLARALDDAGVRVLAYDDASGAPDAVFPNNWISFHADGRVVLYPLLSPLRRTEVQLELIERVAADARASWPSVVDLRALEARGGFLEGTGSVVLDRAQRVAYACLSPRTTAAGLAAFAERMAYDVVAFHAVDAGQAIYHTNVMLSIGEGFAVAGLDAVPDERERDELRRRLEESGHEVVGISAAQVGAFAGNLLALRAEDGDPRIVLSDRALASLERAERARLERHGEIVHAPLETIEIVGGGSARCMLAEVHAPSGAGEEGG